MEKVKQAFKETFGKNECYKLVTVRESEHNVLFQIMGNHEILITFKVAKDNNKIFYALSDSDLLCNIFKIDRWLEFVKLVEDR